MQADRCVCGEITVGVRCPAKSSCSVAAAGEPGGWLGRESTSGAGAVLSATFKSVQPYS